MIKSLFYKALDLKMVNIEQISFEKAQAQARELSIKASVLGMRLDTFPKGEMGLVLEDVRNSEEYKEVDSEYKKAFKALQDFNKAYTKKFKKELRLMGYMERSRMAKEESEEVERRYAEKYKHGDRVYSDGNSNVITYLKKHNISYIRDGFSLLGGKIVKPIVEVIEKIIDSDIEESSKIESIKQRLKDTAIQNKVDQKARNWIHQRAKEQGDYKSPPKGYVRVRNMLNPERIAIFRLASAKSKIETKEVGIIYIMAQNGEWYFVVPDLGTYGFGSKQSKKSLDEITKGIQNIIPTIIKTSKEATSKPLPYKDIILKDDVKRIKDMIGLFGSRERDLEDTYVTAISGEVTVLNKNRTVSLKDKIKIPDIQGAKAYDIKSISGEIYINKDGEFKSTDKTIITTYSNHHMPIELSQVELSITTDAKVLDALLSVQKAVDKNNPKLELNGLLIDAKNGEAKAVGTDTKRLTISSPFKVMGKDGEYIIQKNAINNRTKIVKIGKTSDDKQVTYSETKEYEHTVVTVKGHFPEYQRVIPMHRKYSIKINSKELAKVLRKSSEVYVTFSKGIMVISTHEVVGEDTLSPAVKISNIGKVKIVGEVENKSIGFSSKYVLDALGDSKNITFDFTDSALPFVVTTDDGIKTVIMPIEMPNEQELREKKAEELRRYEERKQEHDREAKIVKEKEIEREKNRKMEEGVAYEYLNTLSPMQRGRARKTLLGLTRYNKGEVLKRAELVNRLVKDEKMSPSFKKWNEWSRRKDKNIEKSSYVLSSEDGSFLEVSKTEAELAQFLIDGTTLVK